MAQFWNGRARFPLRKPGHKRMRKRAETILKESRPKGWWSSTITGSLEFFFCAEGLYCFSFQKQFRKDHVHLILELLPKHLAHELKDSFEPSRSKIQKQELFEEIFDFLYFPLGNVSPQHTVSWMWLWSTFFLPWGIEMTT